MLNNISLAVLIHWQVSPSLVLGHTHAFADFSRCSWSAAFVYSCVVFSNYQVGIVHFDYLELWLAEVCTKP